MPARGKSDIALMAGSGCAMSLFARQAFHLSHAEARIMQKQPSII